jgi:hypothetical protein
MEIRMAYYVDFVGLNTFIYEPVGWSPENQTIVGVGNNYEKINWDGNSTNFPITQNTMGLGLPSIFTYDLKNAKNYLFPHNLPTTASFFPALMLKRNGPYGFPTWKQIRIGQNPLTRRQNKENVFTFVEEPGPEIVMDNNGKLNTVRGKYGAIKKFDENPVSSRYKPFVVGGASIINDGTLERFELVSSYGNETNFFKNEEINKYNGLRVQRSTQYNTVKDFYLNGGLDKDGSPMDTFEFFSYRECVYPPRVYQYKNYTRQRTTFSFPWRDDRTNRTEEFADNGFFFQNIFTSIVTQSVWSLDSYSDFSSLAVETATNGTWQNWSGTRHTKGNDGGILQNRYSFGELNLNVFVSVGSLKNTLGVAPRYNRPHVTLLSSSVVSPNGMKIEGINFGTTFGDISSKQIPSGEAKWEAGTQSGLNPFYDTYDNYIQDVRQHGKDYSIIPEFRISEHIETYESTGLTEEVSNIFSLTGALSDTTDSSKDNFYKIYSTSEFMKHFEVVKKDHKEFVTPNSISLKCKAIKKFLPYEGFYPAQRSVDLAKQFYDSYRDFVAVSGAASTFGVNTNDEPLFQNLMVPTFAPGIFFNTIKSGVAVDYPLIDANLSIATNVTTSNDNYYIKTTTGDTFNRRIPFEALVEPEKHLAGSPVYCNEPHIYANNSGSVSWDGNGNNRYKLMANNFLAETTEFFMREKNMTQISSLPSNDTNVGNAEVGKTYMMRVKMYKSTDQASLPNVSSSGGFYTPPQYSSDTRETFTMYSRPSAFGPPLYLTGTLASVDYDIPLADQGENYAFTPPYYYGQSWADITFTPTRSGKHSIQEIISGSTVAFHRYAPIDTSDNEYIKKISINAHAMDLNASVNLFSQTSAGAAGADPSDPPSRWVIQTKFETPMLNFNHLSASNSITLPLNASQSVPRGMWHQYGNIETDPTKGIFLQVDNVPNAWIDESLGGDSSTVESLADLCGFTTETKKLGEIADTKEIREAVVAVPFIEEEGNRKFFRIPRIDITRAFGTETERALVGDSVLKMIVKMQGYVFPPSMDFLRNDAIDPFAMYIFQFSHTLKKQDLANIWQNLYPEIGRTFDTAESSISHELLAHELLGGGAKLNPEGTLDVNAIGNEIPDRVRWMVFKVKQRANIDYNLKIIGRGDTNLFQEDQAEISYNWPYDFFSLVELAKIETEVKFAERAVKSGQEPRDTIVPVLGNKVGAGGTSLDASLKEVRFNTAAAAQAERRAKGAAYKILKEEEAYQQRVAEDRAKLKAAGALGDGEYQMWQRQNLNNPNSPYELITATQKNSDYDGDGRRDPEDGGYDAGPKPEDN